MASGGFGRIRQAPLRQARRLAVPGNSDAPGRYLHGRARLAGGPLRLGQQSGSGARDDWEAVLPSLRKKLAGYPARAVRDSWRRGDAGFEWSRASRMSGCTGSLTRRRRVTSQSNAFRSQSGPGRIKTDGEALPSGHRLTGLAGWSQLVIRQPGATALAGRALGRSPRVRSWGQGREEMLHAAVREVRGDGLLVHHCGPWGRRSAINCLPTGVNTQTRWPSAQASQCYRARRLCNHGRA
jgi:hypothetical protein